MLDADPVCVTGAYAYVGDWNNLVIFDISDPTDPQPEDSLVSAVDDILAVAVDGDKAYVGYHVGLPGPIHYYLQVFDATDPAGLEPQGSVGLPGILDIDPVGDYVYVSTIQEAFFACDVSDPMAPSIMGALYTPLHLDGAALAGDYFLLADMRGLQVGQLHSSSQSGIVGGWDQDDDGTGHAAGVLTVSPNPVQGSGVLAFQLGRASRVNLSLYDIKGERVARLVDGALAAGPHMVQLDAGELASGIYFAALDVNGRTSTQKVVVAR